MNFTSKNTPNIPNSVFINDNKCDICNKIFTRKTNLNVHKRIHTGEKPFQCLFCNQKFRWRTQLKRHQESCDFLQVKIEEAVNLVCVR